MDRINQEILTDPLQSLRVFVAILQASYDYWVERNQLMAYQIDAMMEIAENMLVYMEDKVE